MNQIIVPNWADEVSDELGEVGHEKESSAVKSSWDEDKNDFTTIARNWINETPNPPGYITFSSSGDESVAFLSNMYPSPFYDDKTDSIFPNVEVYFQSQKYMNRQNANEILQRFLTISNPKVAKKLGGKRGINMTADELSRWKSGQRIFVMYNALVMKFEQNPELFKKLKNTKDKVLIEKLPRFADRFWGVQASGGVNMLGQLLMRIRERLEQQNTKKN